MANVKERTGGQPAILLPLFKALIDQYLEADPEDLVERREIALQGRTDAEKAAQDARAEAPDEPSALAQAQAEADIPADTDGLEPAAEQLQGVVDESDGPLFEEGDK